MSATQRTLAECRKRGYLADVTEKWIPRANIRKDLFGFVDVLCLHEGQTIAIQSTVGGEVSKRILKITQEKSEAFKMALSCGWRIMVWGWRKISVKRGGRKVWALREVELTEKDIQLTEEPTEPSMPRIIPEDVTLLVGLSENRIDPSKLHHYIRALCDSDYPDPFRIRYNSRPKGKNPEKQWLEIRCDNSKGIFTLLFGVKNQSVQQLYAVLAPSGAAYSIDKDGGSPFQDHRVSVEQQQVLSEKLILSLPPKIKGDSVKAKKPTKKKK